MPASRLPGPPDSRSDAIRSGTWARRCSAFSFAAYSLGSPTEMVMPPTPSMRTRLSNTSNSAEAVERLADGRYNATDQRLADRDLRDLAGSSDGIALLHEVFTPEENDAHVVLLEIQDHPRHVVREAQQLTRHRIFKTPDTSNPIPNLENASDRRNVEIGFVSLELLLEDRTDFFGSKRH